MNMVLVVFEQLKLLCREVVRLKSYLETVRRLGRALGVCIFGFVRATDEIE